MLSSDGWLNTGDLGMLTHSGELKITGRAKDTIVLRGGENIEPLPIEQRLRESELIDQAVILGQDQKFLGALIVPNEEALREALREHAEQGAGRAAGSHTVVAGDAEAADAAGAGAGAAGGAAPGDHGAAADDGTGAGPQAAEDLAALIRRPEARSIVEAEVGELVSAKHGFRGFEQIFRVLLVADQFEIGNELSAKQEVKRHVIRENYATEIERLFE